MQKAQVSSSSSSRQQTNNNKIQRPVAYAFAYVNSERTKEQYPTRLRMFFDFCGLEPVTPPDAKKNVKTTREQSEKSKQKFMEELEQQARTFLELARGGGGQNSSDDDMWVSEHLMFYLDSHKQRWKKKDISAGTLHNHLKPIKKFLRAYKDVYTKIDWDRINEALPKPRQYSHDRCPTLDEIRKLAQFPDHSRRIKPLVYVMCSSGIRLGAWDYMRWKHVTPIRDEQTNKVIAAKLLVYAGEDNDEYISFMTGEAYEAVQEYIDFRASYGEHITGDSWVMRTEFRTTDISRNDNNENNNKNKHPGNVSKIDKPEKFHSEAIGRYIVRALQKQGIRDVLPEGQRRHDFRGVHGLRKWFKTRAEQAMLRTNVELLMGHDIGLSTSYYKASERELLTDYLKAVPYLTVNDESIVETLKEQQKELEQREQEKDKKLAEMERRLNEMHQMLQAMQKVNEYHEDHQKLLVQSERYRQAAKEVEEEREELEEELNQMGDS